MFVYRKEVTPVAMYDETQNERPKDRIILHCDCNNFFASVEEIGDREHSADQNFFIVFAFV